MAFHCGSVQHWEQRLVPHITNQGAVSAIENNLVPQPLNMQGTGQ